MGQGGCAFQGQRRNAVIAVDAHHLFDQAGLADDVAAPGGDADGERFAILVDGEAEGGENPLHLARRNVCAAERADAAGAQRDGTPRRRFGAGDHQLRRLAAAQIQDQAGGDLHAIDQEGGVDTALEPVARVRHQVELASRRRRAHGIEQRRFDEDVDGVRGAARPLAADDAAQCLGPVVVGDDRHPGVQFVHLAVQRGQRFPRPGQADVEVAADLVGIEHVQGPAQADGEIIGDVDQGRNGPQPDGPQLVPEPGRAVCVFDATDGAADEIGARVGGFGVELQMDGDGTPERARDRVRVHGLQGPQPGRRQIPGDPPDAQAVAPVGRDRDVDHRIGEAHDAGGGRAHRRVLGKLDDPLVLVAQAHLALGQQHAVAFHAADAGFLEPHPGARNDRPGGREHAQHAGARVGGAAHHLRGSAARVHPADPEAVGVGMGLRRQHPRHHEPRQPVGTVDHLFHLEADHGQPCGDLVHRGVGVQVVLEPAERHLHEFSPPTMLGM